MSHIPLDAIEQTTDVDVTDVHRTVDARFETAHDISNDAEDRFLTVMLSASQLTTEYAESIQNSIDRVCPAGRASSD